MMNFIADRYAGHTGQESVLKKTAENFRSTFIKAGDGSCVVTIPDGELYLYLYSLLDVMSLEILERDMK